MATKSYNNWYQHTPAGRVAILRQYHAKHYGDLGMMDTLTGRDVEWILEQQNYECAACHQPFEDMDDVQLAHITPVEGSLNVRMIQCLCRQDNITQGRLVIPFQWFEQEYGKSFFQYFVDDRDQIIEWFQLTSNDVKRIEKRCIQLGLVG